MIYEIIPIYLFLIYICFKLNEKNKMTYSEEYLTGVVKTSFLGWQVWMEMCGENVNDVIKDLDFDIFVKDTLELAQKYDKEEPLAARINDAAWDLLDAYAGGLR